MSNDGHSKIKILFVIHDLSVGGAEKVLINLVNNMDYLKFDVTVLALFDEGVNKQFLNSKIKYRYAFRHAIRGNSHYMKLLSPKQLYRWLVSDEYDIVISYLEGPSARIVAGCPKTKRRLCLGFIVHIIIKKNWQNHFVTLKRRTSVTRSQTE